MLNKINNITVAAGLSGFLFLANSISAPAYAESWTEEITVELSYLNTDGSKREKEYSKRMNYAIHNIVTKNYDEMQDDAFKALKAAQDEWGPEHLNTLMAVAMAQLAKANAINFFGGGTRAEADMLITRARIFATVYPEFPGSYYIGVLADISKARLILAQGDEPGAAEFYDKALAAMKQTPGISNISWVQSERDYLIVP